MGALEQGLGVDLGGTQGRGRVGGEERVAGAGGEDHHPALLEVAHGATADVRLGDARHLDRRLHAGRLAESFEGVLQGEGVHHRAEHADVVGLGRVHPGELALAAAPEVAAADDDGDVDVLVLAHVDDRASGEVERGAVETAARRAGERLAGGLEDDPAASARR